MTPSERRQLIDSLLEADISEADFLRLEAELSVDAAARREYYDRVTMSLLLENEAAESPSPDKLDAPVPADLAARSIRWRRAFVGMAMVAALLLVAVTLQLTPRSTAPRLDQSFVAAANQSGEQTNAGFAVFSGQADAVWADDRSRSDGSLVPPGELHLLSGVVQFELFSGVLLVVEGEASFSILSPMEVAVSRGRVRARVPEPAQGFRIRTDAGEVVDLGTEFAVSVTNEGSELHVLDGEIEWKPRNSPPRRIEQGEAIRMTADGQDAVPAARPEDFVGPNELRQRLQVQHGSRLERWKENSEALRRDPRLVAFYQVALGDLSGRRLPNRAVGRPEIVGGQQTSSDGAVVAASLVSNRWGEPRGALDFSPAGSRVRLSVPGVHRSLTLLCWVKINSLDRWYNSLFLTDGHDKHEPHWQIMDDGRLFFSVKKRDRFDRSRGELDKHIFFSPPFWNSGLSGQWLMIATVYDVESRQVTHFLNGEVLGEESIPEEYLVETVRIGNASIGNWGLPNRNEPHFAVRNLNGSLDEFALFSAALSADEIRKLYVDGKP